MTISPVSSRGFLAIIVVAAACLQAPFAAAGLAGCPRGKYRPDPAYTATVQAGTCETNSQNSLTSEDDCETASKTLDIDNNTRTINRSDRPKWCYMRNGGVYFNTKSSGGSCTSSRPCLCVKSCLSCPAGKYTAQTGRTYCSSCSTGTYMAQTGKTKCSSCSTGTYMAQTGRTKCFSCASGQYTSEKGQATCSQTACVAGQHGPAGQTSSGAATCAACSSGRYTTQAGQTACNGTVCNEGRAGPTGQASSKKATCTQCSGGKFQDQAGQPSCIKCRVGTFTHQAGESVCLQCQPGKMVKPGAAAGQTSEDNACEDCEAGRYTFEAGQPSCIKCRVGTFTQQAGESECLGCEEEFEGLCSLGVTSTIDRSSCICYDPCPRGYFGFRHEKITTNRSALCAFCLDGSNATRRSRRRTNSTIGCTPCPVGTYRAYIGAVNITDCVLCPPGTYNDKLGGKDSDYCKMCPEGRFNPASGQNSSTACQLCDPGRYQEEIGQAVCTFCSPGTFGDQQGQAVGSRTCKKCPVGTYSAAQGASEPAQCTECPLGKFGDEEKAGATKADTCTSCPVSKHGIAPGKSSETTGCRVCETPGYQDETGQASCKPANCPAGKWGSRPPHCANCSAGSYYPSRGLGNASGCFPCSSGAISPLPGATGCRSCPVREVASADATRCICDRSYYRVDGRCIPCPDALDCSETGATLEGALLKPGYWRASSLAREFYPCRVRAACNRSSTIILQANKSANASASRTSNSSDQEENYYCAAGQRGPLCALCEPGFSRWSNKVMCTPCPEELGTGIAMSILSIIGMLVLLVLCLFFNRKAPNGILRPLINAAQMMMVVLMFPVDWPESIMVMTHILEGINFSFVKLASPSCIGVPINFYWRFIIMVVVTAAIIGLPWLVCKLRHRKNVEKWDDAVKARLRDTFLIVVLLHPTLAGMAFYHFRCQTVANTSYVMADYSLVCGDETWHWMLIPVLFVTIFFALGMPLLFAFVLWRRRHKLLDDAKTKRLYGMLYSAYKPDYYYFESVIMFFKLGLWAILVFFKNGSQFQLAASALLCVVQVGIHARYEPYEDHAKNVLQYLGLFLIAFTSFSGLVLNYLKTSRELAIERGDKQDQAYLESCIAAANFAAEFTLWLGVVLVVVRATIATVSFVRKNKDKLRATAARLRKKVSSGAAKLRRHLTSKGGSSSGGSQGGGSTIELAEHKTSEVDADAVIDMSISSDTGGQQIAAEENRGRTRGRRRRQLRLLRKTGAWAKKGQARDHKIAKGSGSAATREAAAGLVGMDSASETGGPLAWVSHPSQVRKAKSKGATAGAKQ